MVYLPEYNNGAVENEGKMKLRVNTWRNEVLIFAVAKVMG